MRHSELSPEARVELQALDAILAREPVGEEQLELAALVDSVRGDAPALTEDAAARIEARVFARRGLAGSERRRSVRPQLALAGGSLLAVAVAGVIVLSSGLLSTKSPGASTLSPALGPQSAQTSHPTTPPASGGAVLPAVSGAAKGGAAKSGGTAPTPLAVKPAGRLLSQAASLALVAPAPRLQSVAAAIAARTRTVGGVVESSNVTLRGGASHASFKLSVASADLSRLIASLSRLGAVRSLTRASSDITERYEEAQAGLAAEQTARAALIKELAAAGTRTAPPSIQLRITTLDGEVALASEHLDALASSARTATISVSVSVSGGAGTARTG
jgi:hypothetical protein